LRHVGIALCGWVTMLCAALLARLIAGWQAGIFTLILMLLSPRFVGDSLMNPKDIPFAMGYMLAIYNMAAVLDRMPRPERWNVAGLVAGLGISLAMRAGGLLNFAYLFLFAGLFLVLKHGFAALFNGKTLGRYALVIGGAAVGGYVLALLFWPFAMQKPLSNPLYALQKFSDFEITIRVLFDGDNVKSDQTPWTYPIKWIAYTIPLAALLGFVGSWLLLPRLLKRYQPLWVMLVLFAAVFPVVYVIYKKSNLYDGWRQLTFAYPTLAVAAGLFWNELTRFFLEKKAVQYVVYAAFALLVADAGLFIARNPQIPYVYFNPTVGGIGGAFGKYETDYWGVSVRQGVEWLEQQGVLKPDMQEPVVIATNMLFPLRQFTAKYGDKVRLKYLKWEKRCDDAWDYGLYPTRFIDGNTLQRGFWPPDNAVHLIKANDTPVLAILKDNGRNCALGMAAFKLNDWKGAAERLRAEVQNVPDNEVAWVNLAQSLMNLNQLDSAKMAAEKVLEIAPDDMQANNLIGIYWLNMNDGTKAKAAFETAIKKEPSNPGAWYYLAIIAQVGGDNQTALRNLDKAIQLSPNFKPAYDMAARIYESMGDSQQAQRIRAAMPK
ncbi:MAG TPA: tetratricopeptide repeat protein, partial [Saprospiraceae bacterium]|nr:tetratricopeptide repeat protein [Saprospiraceae bacterium]